MASLHHSNEKMNPHLSVVVTSRNDNHGGRLLYRMQYFVNGFIEQCNRYKLVAELIIVEWNPPEEHLPLAQALQFPSYDRYCKIRIIKVPKEVHMKFDHSDKIPLFQMLGKNVGIRRAQGKFVLATNIDILFSNQIIKFLKKKLKPGYSYRVDRLDVPKELPKTNSFDELLKFCRKNVLHANTRFGTLSSSNNSGRSLSESNRKVLKSPLIANPCDSLRKYYSKNPIIFVRNLLVRLYEKMGRSWANNTNFRMIRIPGYKLILRFFTKALYPLNTNACGDFTLLSAADWANLRGYPEWHGFSWNLDGVLIFQAQQHGLKEIELSKAIYHIDHDGGFAVRSAQELFHRLDSKGIPYISGESLSQLHAEMKNSETKIVYNDENWGMADQQLEEIDITCTRREGSSNNNF